MHGLTTHNIARDGACAITQNNSVRDSLERLKNNILTLEESIAILIEMIEPVRTPEIREPSAAGTTAPRPKEHKSPIELAIDEATDAVVGIVGRVNQAKREVSI